MYDMMRPGHSALRWSRLGIGITSAMVIGPVNREVTAAAVFGFVPTPTLLPCIAVHCIALQCPTAVSSHNQEFAKLLFQHCEALRPLSGKYNELFEYFRSWKGTIPTAGKRT